MLRCSVCNDRPKGVVITRCYHMFCAECVNVRLENRDRKCPGCAAAFSASDVKAIYF
jgi:E3 ubiquitin-protein ligase BRE1